MGEQLDFSGRTQLYFQLYDILYREIREGVYKPGQLLRVSDIVSACGANIVAVHHDRGDTNMAITSCFLKLGLETRNAAQIEEIKEKLTEAGFVLVSERV